MSRKLRVFLTDRSCRLCFPPHSLPWERPRRPPPADDHHGCVRLQAAAPPLTDCRHPPRLPTDYLSKDQAGRMGQPV